MRILSIDPGIAGGLALIDTTACTLAVVDMPCEAATRARSLTSPTKLIQLLRDASPDHVFLEEVGVRPGEGAVGAFSFGRGFGRLEAAVAALGLPSSLVRPQVWKARMHCPADKRQATTRARALFPAALEAFQGPRGGVRDGRAEAAILALYGALTLSSAPARPLRVVPFSSSMKGAA